jgi:hypothetical protein
MFVYLCASLDDDSLLVKHQRVQLHQRSKISKSLDLEEPYNNSVATSADSMRKGHARGYVRRDI